MTPEQIATFAQVVDDSESRVRDRLARDPGLAALALRAAEARDHRKTVGGLLAGIGVTVFVGGDIAGAVIIVTTPGYPQVTDTSRVLLGVVVSLASAAVGAGLAVPGFIKMGKSSEEENRAAQEYKEQTHDSRPEVSALLPRSVIEVPVVSLSF